MEQNGTLYQVSGRTDGPGVLSTGLGGGKGPLYLCPPLTFCNSFLLFIAGGMQDYNYIWGGCMEITLEISCCKYPTASQLPMFWEQNRRAMLKYLGEAHRGEFVGGRAWFLLRKFGLPSSICGDSSGVRGFVRDEFGNPVENAILKIKGREIGFRTTKNGEFWRILLPGIYRIEVRESIQRLAMT